MLTRPFLRGCRKCLAVAVNTYVSFVVRADAAPVSSCADIRMKYAFRDGQFMSAREKRLVLNAWVRFLKNGMRFEDFSDRLYRHLTLHCSFIAHYDRSGFYQTYFANGEDAARFFTQFDKRGECHSVEYGGAWWLSKEYEDINGAMIEEASEYIPGLLDWAWQRAREADLAEAKRLASKHGLQVCP